MMEAGVEQLSKLSGVLPIRLERLFTLLKAPDELPQLLLVMTNLKKALTAVEDTPDIRDELDDDVGGKENSLFGYLTEITQVIDSLSACSTGACPEAWLDQSGKQRGIINACPEWAMLTLTPSAECYDSDIYWLHTGIILGCCALQRKRHSERIGSEITGACRVIRTIANGKKSLELLGEIDSNASLKSYHRNHLVEGDDVFEPLSGIELLVRKVLQLKGKSRDGGGGGGRAGRVVERQVVLPDEDDKENEGPEQSVQLLESVGDEQTQSRQRTAGLHPKETQLLRAVSFTERKVSPTLGFDPKDLIRRQNRQVQHISLANQRLPFRYSSLSRVELSLAAQGAFKLFTGRGRFEKRSGEGVYAGLLLMLMIWLGRPVEQLLGMRVYRHRGELPKYRKGVLAFLIEEHAFVLPIPSPEWRNNLQDDAKRLLYEAGESTPSLVEDAIIVASPIRVGKFIAHTELARKGRAKYREMFPEELRGAIEKTMREAVSKINREHRMRLTPLRITQALFDEIIMYSSDWVDGYLLTGHRFTITEVAAHYYSVSAKRLEYRFHQAVISLRNSIYRHLSVDEQHYYDFRQDIDNDGEHGSKLNIKSQLLIRLVKHLKSKLHEARRLSPSEESCRQVHNHFVAYIAFWVLFTTGFRAVNDLVFRLREIDFNTGFLVISDKDDEAMSQARVVWLLPELLDQLRHYVKCLI